ncbi:glutamate 5-kinase [Euzebya sp.]|uniref:glutamate 5-kinase n=1 Tax=Euzebya sp. TaxID=1971409 RepID=UPI0035140620
MTRRYDRPGRVVVKLGSSTLTAADGGLDRDVVEAVCAQIAALVGDGVDVVLVSSGAVAAGLRPLGLDRRPEDLGRLQAAASVGQGALVHAYATALARHGLPCGQVLLTPDDVIDRQRYLNARTTVSELLRMGAVPVVNENDTVVTDELRFGDNDRLAALVASMLDARLLVLLSDVEGLHDGDPASGAPVIDVVPDLAALDARHAGPSSSGLGRGGMATKLEAARIATFSAAHCVIARGRRPDVITDVAEGRAVGTWFPPTGKRPDSRRLWLAFAHQPTGRLHVDAGAVRALSQNGASLLAIGVTAAEGDFVAGDAVDLVGPDGRPVARGIVAFDADVVEAMKGRPTDVLVDRFGAEGARPVLHRDQLVLIG